MKTNYFDTHVYDFRKKGGVHFVWQEIYGWLEQHSGVSYDFNEDISKISGSVAFIEPYDWFVAIDNIFDGLDDAMDVIDDYSRMLPDNFPSKTELKKFISGHVIGRVLEIVNYVKQMMSIEQTEINKYSELMEHVRAMSDLIIMISDYSMEDIIKDDMFEKYDEDNDNVLTDKLNIHKNDMPNIHSVVTTIRDDYFTEDDEDEE